MKELEVVTFTNQEILLIYEIKKIVGRYKNIIKYIQISNHSIVYEKLNGLLNVIDYKPSIPNKKRIFHNENPKRNKKQKAVVGDNDYSEDVDELYIKNTDNDNVEENGNNSSDEIVEGNKNIEEESEYVDDELYITNTDNSDKIVKDNMDVDNNEESENHDNVENDYSNSEKFVEADNNNIIVNVNVNIEQSEDSEKTFLTVKEREVIRVADNSDEIVVVEVEDNMDIDNNEGSENLDNIENDYSNNEEIVEVEDNNIINERIVNIEQTTEDSEQTVEEIRVGEANINSINSEQTVEVIRVGEANINIDEITPLSFNLNLSDNFFFNCINFNNSSNSYSGPSNYLEQPLVNFNNSTNLGPSNCLEQPLVDFNNSTNLGPSNNLEQPLVDFNNSTNLGSNKIDNLEIPVNLNNFLYLSYELNNYSSYELNSYTACDTYSLNGFDRNNELKEELKADILSTEDFSYRVNETFQRKEEVDLLGIVTNCIVSEIQSELQNCKLLIYFFRIGALLKKILDCLKDDISGLPENNIVTGLMKGTGITQSFKSIYGKYSSVESRKANYFLSKCMRVHKAYEGFQYPGTQIYRANKVTPSKLLKVGNKKIFEEFAQEIKDEIARNSDKYNKEGDEIALDFTFITNEILENVKRFAINPSLSIDD